MAVEGGNLVLASLTIDSNGVVGGIASSTQAFQQGEAALKKFGTSQSTLGINTDKLVSRLTGFKQAFLSLTSVISVSGAVLALASALRTLITDLVSSTTWFKKASDTATDWYNAIVKGETASQRLTRQLQEMNKAAGITNDKLDQQAHLNILLEKRQELMDKMTGVDKAKASATAVATTMSIPGGHLLGAAGALFFGGPGGGGPPSAEALGVMQHNLDEINKEIGVTQSKLAGTFRSESDIAAETKRIAAETKAWRDEAQKINDAAGLFMAQMDSAEQSVKEFQEFFGADTGEGKAFAFAGISDPAEFAGQMQSIQQSINVLNESFGQGRITAEQYDLGLHNLTDKLVALGFTAEESNAKLQEFGASLTLVRPPETDPWIDWQNSVTSALTAAQLKADLAASAMSAFAGTMTSAFTGQPTSLKKFLANMLEAMVPVLVGYGSIALVAALLGDHSKFAVAGIAFAAAAAAGAAAKALGGGGGSVSGDRGGGHHGRGGEIAAPLTTGVQAPNNPAVTIVVQGSMIGTDPDNLARDLTKLINTATNDGAK
jgi:hypothetical protein